MSAEFVPRICLILTNGFDIPASIEDCVSSLRLPRCVHGPPQLLHQELLAQPSYFEGSTGKFVPLYPLFGVGVLLAHLEPTQNGA